jgi:NAD(P)-dependent dehydrogenase (short-subunit alcohol dehydrogenase family)
MSTGLEHKVVLVTGGGSGIGRATALKFALAKAKIVVADVSAQAGAETARIIAEAGGEATFISCDVSRASDVEAAVAKTVQIYGRLDCAFNNAGIPGTVAPTAEWSEEIWDRVVAINLKGVWLCMKYEIPEMLKIGKGAIVNMSSISGLVGCPGLTGYTATKHGVLGLTKSVALEYAKAGIRINAVCPATIQTPLIDAVLKEKPDMRGFLDNVQPMGRIGTTDEVAAAVLWLCSDEASFMTGHAMAIDGGVFAQ